MKLYKAAMALTTFLLAFAHQARAQDTAELSGRAVETVYPLNDTPELTPIPIDVNNPPVWQGVDGAWPEDDSVSRCATGLVPAVSGTPTEFTGQRNQLVLDRGRASAVTNGESPKWYMANVTPLTNGARVWCVVPLPEPEPPVCGNGQIEGAEACDSGTGNGNDGYCDEQCHIVKPEPPPAPVCGNAFIEAGEACDDGSGNGTDGYCSADCRILQPAAPVVKDGKDGKDGRDGTKLRVGFDAFGGVVTRPIMRGVAPEGFAQFYSASRHPQLAVAHYGVGVRLYADGWEIGLTPFVSPSGIQGGDLSLAAHWRSGFVEGAVGLQGGVMFGDPSGVPGYFTLQYQNNEFGAYGSIAFGGPAAIGVMATGGPTWCDWLEPGATESSSGFGLTGRAAIFLRVNP